MGQGVWLLHDWVSFEEPGHGPVELHERVLVQVPFDPVSHVTEQVEKELQSLQPVISKHSAFTWFMCHMKITKMKMTVFLLWNLWNDKPCKV